MGSAGRIRTIWPCATKSWLPIGRRLARIRNPPVQIFGQQSSDGRPGEGSLGRDDGTQRPAHAGLDVVYLVFRPAEAKRDTAQHLPGRHLQRITSTSLLECPGAAAEWRRRGLASWD